MYNLLRKFGTQSIASLRERLCASGDEAGRSGLLKHVGSYRTLPGNPAARHETLGFDFCSTRFQLCFGLIFLCYGHSPTLLHFKLKIFFMPLYVCNLFLQIYNLPIYFYKAHN